VERVKSQTVTYHRPSQEQIINSHPAFRPFVLFVFFVVKLFPRGGFDATAEKRRRLLNHRGLHETLRFDCAILRRTLRLAPLSAEDC
jgi:hypothetical protein